MNNKYAVGARLGRLGSFLGFFVANFIVSIKLMWIEISRLVDEEEEEEEPYLL